jgi:membrane-associated phospholipid phosphatase
VSPTNRPGRHGAAAASLRRLTVILLAAALLVTGGFSLLGLLVTRVIDGSALIAGEVGVNRDLAQGRTPTWNTVTETLTWLAATPTVVIAAAVVAGCAAVVGRRREAAYVAAAVAGEAAVFLLVTLVVDRPRPPVPHLDEAPPTSAFPSGHTAASIVLSGSIAVLAWRLGAPRPIRVVAVVAAILVPALVAGSRLYRGMHSPSDVVAGALLGLVWLAAVTYLVLRPAGLANHPAAEWGQAVRPPGSEDDRRP